MVGTMVTVVGRDGQVTGLVLIIVRVYHQPMGLQVGIMGIPLVMHLLVVSVVVVEVVYMFLVVVEELLVGVLPLEQRHTTPLVVIIHKVVHPISCLLERVVSLLQTRPFQVIIPTLTDLFISNS